MNFEIKMEIEFYSFRQKALKLQTDQKSITMWHL